MILIWFTGSFVIKRRPLTKLYHFFAAVTTACDILFHAFSLQYKACSVEHDVIQWFWNIVSQLKEEEKALLMKFSTGSPCVPVGGFAALTVWIWVVLSCRHQYLHGNTIWYQYRPINQNFHTLELFKSCRRARLETFGSLGIWLKWSV